MTRPATVSQLNHYLKSVIDNDPKLRNFPLVGELSNFKMHPNGHWYFTLKDEKSRVSATMFATYNKKVTSKFKDGDKVLVTANVTVYEVGGNYQLNVLSMEPMGVGDLHLEFEKLKKKLFAEGLFEDKYKKPIPKYPTNIGVITAKKGAAIKDIVSTIKRRWPIANITLIPSLVQGDGAKESLVECLKIADSMSFDVIIFGRGGGSLEDLWPFNEEIVARQIFATKTPVVSAVGHEIDWTISDFVADLRAPTPTGAGEMVTPNLDDVIEMLLSNKKRLKSNLTSLLENNKKLLLRYKEAKVLKYAEEIYATKRLMLDGLHKSLDNAYKDVFYSTNNKLTEFINDITRLFKLVQTSNIQKIELFKTQLNALNPNNVLERGYGIVTSNNKVIDSVKGVKTNDEVQIQLKDGLIISNVKETKEN